MTEFATGLTEPRVIVRAPNGDLFLAESRANRVRVFRDASTGNIHLFVFNQSTTESTTLSGFETWNVVSWKQLKGASYSDSNLLGVAGPETIQAQALTLPVTGAPLAIAPISVNHIVLAASVNQG